MARDVPEDGMDAALASAEARSGRLGELEQEQQQRPEQQRPEQQSEDAEMDELEPTVEDPGMGWSRSRSRTALCFTGTRPASSPSGSHRPALPLPATTLLLR